MVKPSHLGITQTWNAVVTMIPSIAHLGQFMELFGFSVHRVVTNIKLDYLKHLAPCLGHSNSMNVNYYSSYVIVKEIPKEMHQVNTKFKTPNKWDHIVQECRNCIPKSGPSHVFVNKDNISLLLTLCAAQFHFES